MLAGPRPIKAMRKAPRRSRGAFSLAAFVMAKAPVAGRRQDAARREAGVATAARFARHSVAALLQRVAAMRPWTTTLAVTPDSRCTAGCGRAACR